MASQQLCVFHARGKCTKGPACSHDHAGVEQLAVAQGVCKFHLSGRCSFGVQCKNKHTEVVLPTQTQHKPAPPNRALAIPQAGVLAKPPTHPGVQQMTHAFSQALNLGPGVSGLQTMARHQETREQKLVVEQRVKKYSDVHVFLDTSGSMSGSRLQAATQALVELANELEDNDALALHTFNGSVSQVVPLTRKRDLKGFSQKVAALKADGSTALYDAIAESVKCARETHSANQQRAKAKKHEHTNRLQRVVILTDGEDVSSRTTLEDAIAALKKPGTELYKTFVLAVGEAMSNQSIKRAHAEVGPLELVQAEDASDIAAAFKHIRTVLRNVTVQTQKQVVTMTRQVQRVLVDGKPAKGVPTGFVKQAGGMRHQ